MTDNERDLLLVCKDLLEICRWKCSPTDEIVRPDGISNEQVMIAAMKTIKRIETANKPKPIKFHSHPVSPPGTLSNAEIRRRNGGVKHQFEDDIGGCSANYR
jgi:hypothetical protein